MGLSFNRRTSARHAEDEGAIPFSSTTLWQRSDCRIFDCVAHASAGQRSGHLSVKQGIAGSNPVGGAILARSARLSHWSSGQDGGLSSRRGGFDSLMGYQYISIHFISAHLVIEDRHASLVRKRAGFESLDGLCIHHKRPWPSS